MNSLFAQCLCATLCLAEPPQQAAGYLYQPAYKLDHEQRPPARPYYPQPGDMFFAADDKLTSVLGFALAGSWYPNHNAIVVPRTDGTLGALHTHLRQGMVIEDVMEILQRYEDKGRGWVR